MKNSLPPQKYPQLWVDLPQAYIACVATALVQQGVQVTDLWPDPCEPRDATIKLAGPEPLALVWDEVSGWRYAPYVTGRRGVRTKLVTRKITYIGDRVLPAPRAVARDLVAESSRPEPPSYRSYLDFADGLDDQLRGYDTGSHPYGCGLYDSPEYTRLIEPLLARAHRTDLAA